MPAKKPASAAPTAKPWPYPIFRTKDGRIVVRGVDIASDDPLWDRAIGGEPLPFGWRSIDPKRAGDMPPITDRAEAREIARKAGLLPAPKPRIKKK